MPVELLLHILGHRQVLHLEPLEHIYIIVAVSSRQLLSHRGHPLVDLAVQIAKHLVVLGVREDFEGAEGLRYQELTQRVVLVGHALELVVLLRLLRQFVGEVVIGIVLALQESHLVESLWKVE